ARVPRSHRDSNDRDGSAVRRARAVDRRDRGRGRANLGGPTVHGKAAGRARNDVGERTGGDDANRLRRGLKSPGTGHYHAALRGISRDKRGVRAETPATVRVSAGRRTSATARS